MDKNREYRSCKKKHKMTKVKAEKIVGKMAKKHKKEFNAYLCKFCKSWHVGHCRTDWHSFMRQPNKIGKLAKSNYFDKG